MERVFLVGLFNVLGVDGSVLARSPTVDVAGLGAVGVSDLVGLDLSGHESALICRSFDLEAFSFFAKRCDLGLEAFAGAADLDVVVLLSSNLGDGCNSSAACVGVSTLGTPSVFWMRSILGTPSAFWMRRINHITR